MKKVIIVLLLSLCSIVRAFSQQQGLQGSIDLIVLLDTSASMSSHYPQAANYLSGPFLREFLRIGDTFHLISFSASPRTELARKVEGRGDVETILGRITIMYPLGSDSDVNRALEYTERYITALPAGRQKKVALITDGDHLGTEGRISETTARLRRLGAEFYLVQFPLTGNGPGSGRAARSAPRGAAGSSPANSSVSAGAAAAPQPRTVPPRQDGTAQTSAGTAAQTANAAPSGGSSGPATAVPALPAAPAPNPAAAPSSTPLQDRPIPPAGPAADLRPAGTGDRISDTIQPNPAATASTVAGDGVINPAQSGRAITQAKPVHPPAFPFQPRTRPAGTSPKPVGPQDRTRTNPALPTESVSSSTPDMTGTIPAPPVSTKEQTDTIAGKAQQEKNRNGFPFFIILFAVLALGLLGAAGFGAVRIFQHLNSSPGRAMAYVAGKIVSSPPRLQTPPDLKSVPMISIFVEDQNTSIGRRNIHALKAGNRYTIGGGKSDFLIFLVPLPPHIGELHFDGQQCTFVPKRPEYFPDTGSEMVPNCIGKTIRVLSDNHYQLSFRMERYEDPLKALNRLLNSVNVESALRV